MNENTDKTSAAANWRDWLALIAIGAVVLAMALFASFAIDFSTGLLTGALGAVAFVLAVWAVKFHLRDRLGSLPPPKVTIQFAIRDLLWSMTLVAFVLGWLHALGQIKQAQLAKRREWLERHGLYMEGPNGTGRMVKNANPQGVATPPP